MQNFLSTTITIYNDVTDQNGRDITLGEFLDDRSQLALIEQIRATDDKETRRKLKARLHCATISARCKGGRKESDAFEHTGLMCVDIDGQDNPAFPDAQSLKKEICKVAEVLYCSLSVSGHGCFAIFRPASTEHFAGHFKAIDRLFKQRLGINIDTQCGNVKRLRYASHDPEPHINEDAPAFLIVDKEEQQSGKLADKEPQAQKPPNRPTDSVTLPYQKLSDEEKAERYVAELERTHTDITAGYDQWVRVGMALCALGEAGRSLFHRVSRLNGSYKSGEADKKFTELLRTTHSIGLGTFFLICQENGTQIK